jgi:hypothetical protein
MKPTTHISLRLSLQVLIRSAVNTPTHHQSMFIKKGLSIISPGPQNAANTPLHYHPSKPSSRLMQSCHGFYHCPPVPTRTNQLGGEQSSVNCSMYLRACACRYSPIIAYCSATPTTKVQILLSGDGQYCSEAASKLCASVPQPPAYFFRSDMTSFTKEEWKGRTSGWLRT